MKPKTKLMAVFLIGILAASTAIAYNYIDSITHETVGDDEIKITVIITNTDSEDRYFKLYLLRASDGKQIAYKTGFESSWYKPGMEETGFKVESGETVTQTFSSNWDLWDIYSLEGGYIIRLEEKDLGVVDQTDIIDVLPPSMPVACSCSCHGSTIESPVNEDDYEKCPELCGKKCAGFTDCKEDCTSCCSSYCQDAGLPSEGVAACEDSCEDACSFNSTTYGLIDMIRYIAIAVAAIVLAACGLKFLVSDDPESRREAKRCFLYLLFAITLLGIAQVLVGLFYDIPETEPSTTTMPTTNIYIAYIGDAVVSCWDSSTGGPDKFCENIDVSGWVTYTVTEDDVKGYLDSIGRDDVKDKMDWKIGTDIDKTLGDDVCIKYDTTLGNEVFVMKQSQDTMCI